MSKSDFEEVLLNDATAQKIPLVQATLGNDVTLGDMIKLQPLFKEYWEHFSAKQPDLSGWKPKDKLLKYEKELRAIWVPRNNIAKTWTQIEVNNEPTNLYFKPEYAKRVFLDQADKVEGHAHLTQTGIQKAQRNGRRFIDWFQGVHGVAVHMFLGWALRNGKELTMVRRRCGPLCFSPILFCFYTQHQPITVSLTFAFQEPPKGKRNPGRTNSRGGRNKKLRGGAKDDKPSQPSGTMMRRATEAEKVNRLPCPYTIHKILGLTMCINNG